VPPNPTIVRRGAPAGWKGRGTTASGLFVMIGTVVGFVISAVSMFGSIAHGRLDSGLGEVASLRAQPRLVGNIIDTALFLDGQCLEDAPARLPFGRDLVDASAI
jgi:hypothetical protein